MVQVMRKVVVMVRMAVARVELVKLVRVVKAVV